ncbi:hypothetical protein [Alkalihalobacillus pseudalcaliphilus]|uniref:hypothetical protein n=1 Tax=Alkalihalobacillus pseudalcaliphilus TaxID=79884 RepID=UPI00064D9CE1|nr:hypothetical protein [Alkalihalobacillus pseudalcaliphilus]KMK74644.1 hypothetical protein AB990_19295 [Alkalihalobacillus pseudalcaliphilus]
MANRMRYYTKPKRHNWLGKFRDLCGQFLLPLICFQFIRTLLLPSVFDVLLLTIMVVMYASIWFKLW